MKIPRSALVLVADGSRALLLRNRGGSASPELQTEVMLERGLNPRSHEKGRDRPGRVYASASFHRSAVESADLHKRSEAEFARQMAEAVPASRDPLIIVAPPRFLGMLRQAISQLQPGRPFAEVQKDFTRYPVHEIQARLAAFQPD